MAPMYGQPNYNFIDDEYTVAGYKDKEETNQVGLTQMAFWYMVVLVGMLCLWLIIFFCLRMIAMGQKTRTQQQRRMYGSSQRRRPTDPAEPTIFVSPANLPPPPKYEALAPPSYEEAVGVNYQEFQRTQVQPITFPLTHAATQAATEATNNSSDVNNDEQTVSQATLATITTVDERRTSVAQS
ncbi:uncharacterized protein LOC113509379 isoform X2 [Galleria mellonella]|uniref:Uncharacterized protein LOC113509379 isoform X2 n=1 Tax=Galleria mellonella TaxID=7137 RepID=A0A6J1W722_GALME|nr:uncharacterized protein LOC113509379 isoform X2 [Galleria mellonella]